MTDDPTEDTIPEEPLPPDLPTDVKDGDAGEGEPE